MLGLVVTVRGSRYAHPPGESSESRWKAPLALLAYAAAFSFAYLSLSASMGALLLFAAVQLTMLTAAFVAGERMLGQQMAGFAVAIVGLVYLLSPGLTAPPVVGSTLMLISGVAWGLYSLWGRGASDPLSATTHNFARSAPLGVLLALLFWADLNVTTLGVLLAVISGAVTSGLGYVIWYAALDDLTAMQAATVQLTVPVLAALGGVLFLSESPSIRLAIASVLILGGVALTLRRSANSQ